MYVFIDDSGDAGVKFNRGSSTHLVMAACVVPNDSALIDIQRVMSRMPRHLKTAGEFKHSKMKASHKEEFFRALESMNFHVRTIIVDKRELKSGFLREHANEMKSYFIKQLLTHTWGQIENAQILIDGADLRAFGVKSTQYLLSQINSEEVPVALEIACRDSKEELGLQLADMVAGTIMSGITKGIKVTKTESWQQVRKRAYHPKGNWWIFRDKKTA
nr:DUF3800 domain-containing protein [Finegoldia magna]